MWALPAAIYLATEPCDMRNGPDGLAALVKRRFGESAYSGAMFAFLSQRRDRIKILVWSHGGFVVHYKRLERGTFRRPREGPDGRVVLSPGELSALLEGIDLRDVARARLFHPRTAA